MIINISADGVVELRRPHEATSFKIVVARAAATPDVLAAALRGIATLEPDGRTAWVSQRALKRWQGQEQPADWATALDRLVEAMSRAGGVRDEDGSVRARIEVLG